MQARASRRIIEETLGLHLCLNQVESMYKRMLKHLFLLLVLCSPAFSAQEHTLFVIHAKQGVIQPDKAVLGNWELQLTRVDKSVTFFSDPPNRRAGTYSIDTFLKLWMKRPEKKDAGFIFFDLDGEDFSDIPVNVISANYNPKLETLTLSVQLLDSDVVGGKQQLNEVTLFIDIFS